MILDSESPYSIGVLDLLVAFFDQEFYDRGITGVQGKNTFGN